MVPGEVIIGEIVKEHCPEESTHDWGEKVAELVLSIETTPVGEYPLTVTVHGFGEPRMRYCTEQAITVVVGALVTSIDAFPALAKSVWSPP